jgi:hypothetical protein
MNLREIVNRAHFKPLQLKSASDSGMMIPTTLISSNTDDIQAFLKAHRQEGVMYQPLHALGFPTIELKSTAPYPTGPGIFQKKVKMKYAIRVVCFEQKLLAEKVTSRVSEPYSLQDSLIQSIRTCMVQLSLGSAAFDFIQTPDDACIFMNLSACPKLITDTMPACLRHDLVM